MKNDSSYSNNSNKSSLSVAKHKPYPAYKESGIEWLGEVPEHWDIQKVKHAVTYAVSNVDKKTQEGEASIRLFNYTDVYNNEFLTNEMDLMVASASQGQIGNFIANVDDVLVTKDSEDWRDIAKPALVISSAPDIVCGYHLALIRPYKNRTEGKFIFRLLQSALINQQFQITSNGVTRYGLPKSAIGEALITIPPIQEQKAIAAFLDRETARIDALIQKKERLIELLKEKRIALITYAVTKGLDPKVKMKDSGIEWLGDVPEHWEVYRLRYNIRLNPSKNAISHLDRDTELSFIPMDNVGVDGSLNLDTVRTISEVECGYTFFAENDVAIAKITPCFENGKGCVFHSLVGGYGFGTTELTVMRPRDMESKYLFYITISDLFRKIGEGWMQGSAGQKRVPDEFIKEFRVPVPSIKEQQAIVEKLHKLETKTDLLLDKAKNSITLLREYRASLINAAVTGKIDLRDEI
ncbi:MAG: restriction endonuclease subunit S [Candidatus Cloacimonetes bacterium HGW-Cloacimonetes-3]|jgi:type I restriction enzyme S subunit|nr:MAG: restriction endonuclease subunit S [Candidatus Cloacimonetes bacterium HGW-Cloacimonetes-3]